MQNSGKLAEAFRPLREFADLCPDQTDIRLMLADQLSKAGKKNEAIEHLQILYEQFEAEGNAAEAEATGERIKAIDPNAELRSAGGPRSAGKAGDLVFLDLGDTPRGRRSIMMKRATLGMKVIDTGDEPEKAKAKPTPAQPAAAQTPAPPPPAAPPVVEPPVSASLDPTGAGSFLGLESTSLSDAGASNVGGVSGLEIDSTSLVEPSSNKPSEEAAAGGPADLLHADRGRHPSNGRA